MSKEEAVSVVYGQMVLTYCDQCGTLMIPTGNGGYRPPTGANTCPTCPSRKPRTAPIKRTSGENIIVARNIPPRTAARPSQRNLQAARASERSYPRQAPAPNRTMILLGGVGVSIAIILAAIIISGRKKPVEAEVAQVTPDSITEVSIADQVVKSEPEEQPPDKHTANFKTEEKDPQPVAARPESNPAHASETTAVKTDETESVPPAQKEVVKTEGPGLAEFEAEWAAMLQMQQDQTFGLAFEALNQMNGKYSGGAFWEQKRSEWEAKRKQLQANLDELLSDAEDARTQFSKTRNSEMLKKGREEWVLRAGLADVQVAQAASAVVKAIDESLKAIKAEENDKKIATIQTRLEQSKSQLTARKVNPNQTQKAGELIKEVELLMMHQSELIPRFANGLEEVQLYYDFVTRNDYRAFGVEPKESRQALEFIYDFSKMKQFNAFGTRGQQQNTFTVDKSGNQVHITARGGNNRRDISSILKWMLPQSVFSGATWVISADFRNLDDKANIEYGLLAWDGANEAIFGGAQNMSRNFVCEIGAISNETTKSSRKFNLEGNIKDKITLSLSSNNTQLNMLASTDGVAQRSQTNPTPLHFDPKFFGIFVRPTTNNDRPGVIVENFKLTVIRDENKIKAQQEAEKERRMATAERNVAARIERKRLTIQESTGRLGKNWSKLWTFSGPEQVVAVDRNGRYNVMQSRTRHGQDCKWSRTVHMTEDKEWFLRFEVCAPDMPTTLKIFQDGAEKLSREITGGGWQKVELKLEPDAFGSQIELRHVHNDRSLLWDFVRINNDAVEQIEDPNSTANPENGNDPRTWTSVWSYSGREPFKLSSSHQSNGTTIETFPFSTDRPARFVRQIKLPEEVGYEFKFMVAGRNAWIYGVTIDGKLQKQETINKQEEWREFVIDLGEYAGKSIQIELLTKPGQQNAIGYWRKVQFEQKKPARQTPEEVPLFP